MGQVESTDPLRELPQEVAAVVIQAVPARSAIRDQLATQWRTSVRQLKEESDRETAKLRAELFQNAQAELATERRHSP